MTACGGDDGGGGNLQITVNGLTPNTKYEVMFHQPEEGSGVWGGTVDSEFTTDASGILSASIKHDNLANQGLLGDRRIRVSSEDNSFDKKTKTTYNIEGGKSYTLTNPDDFE